MMATLWPDSPNGDDGRKGPAVSTACEEKQSDGRERGRGEGVSSGEEEELFSWPGPKTLRLLRAAQGFGFTLRHFIVYPPESAVKDDDRGRRGRRRNRLEPMDTIFVKQVKEGGPAHGAGLCTGDRIVKVNGESIIGRTYSQVIGLIQNSDAVLELCVMPKDEDILQLAYSQDAYLKGHGAFSGNANSIPEPPPVCYPRVELKPAGMAQSPAPAAPGGPAELGGYCVEVQPGEAERVSGACHRKEERRQGAGPSDGSALRSRPPPHPPARPPDPAVFATPAGPASLRSSLAEPFSANHYAPPPSSAATNPAAVSRQNIDWRTYKTYREYVDHKRLHAYGCRSVQERLDSLRAAEYSPAPAGRRRSTSHDRAALHPPGPAPGPAPPRSVSQDRLGLGGRPALTRAWPRGAPQDPKPRTRSCDFLDPPERRGFGRAELQQYCPPAAQPLPVHKPVHQSPLHRAPPTCGHGNGLWAGPPSVPSLTKGAEQQLLAPQADPPKAQRPAAATPNHLPPRPRTESAAPEPAKGAGPAARSASCSAPSSNGPAALKASGRGAEPAVVLREKPPTGRLGPASQPLRHPSYILAVSEADGGPAPMADSACWLPNDARRELRIKQQHQPSAPAPDSLDQSLDSIPFIDEPTSPSADHDAAHIPASAVISVSPAKTAVPPCPLIRRQLSHDQDSLRNTIRDSQSGPKTERSKSCDEGLDDYREEGRRRSSVKHLTSLRGLRRALDGHKTSEDSGSRKDSSSDIFSDSSKEGWLHFRQLNTEKSKRVGGGVRPWKQMYAVLRGHALYLYKDRKEGLSHAAASPSQPVYEAQPISIKACLIDISYSDTKRRNVLRLTTSAGEFLFQALDREDMLSWIRVIQGNSNLGNEQSADVTSQDLISRRIKEYNSMLNSPSSKTEPSPKSTRQSLSLRHTLLGGRGEGRTPSPPLSRHESERKPTPRDESSPPRDRGTWRRGLPGLRRKPLEKKPCPGVTFGMRLDDCPPAQDNKFVPLIVEICCKLVEERGLEYTGIYRVPGNNTAISSLQEELDRGTGPIDVQDDKWKDLNVISSLLKSFFRKLPEPLFTNEKYADFIEANRTEDAVERLKALKTLLQQLPSHHYETLKFLSAHLKTVSEHCEKNKMEPRNLAIVFGPTLVRTSEDNMMHMVTHMPDQYKIVETLIQQYDWFFTEEGAMEPETSMPQESAVESQPVPNIDHLLTNIGRTGLTSPGEVSDSPNSDSAKSKGSWGSGKEQYSRELLRSSIFAAASRKRKKHKEKPLPSSSDDDLDAVFSRKESQNRGPSPSQSQSQNQNQGQNQTQTQTPRPSRPEAQRTESEDMEAGAQTSAKQETEAPLAEEEGRGESGGDKPPCPPPFCSPSPSVSYRGNVARQSSLSDPTSQGDDATSDLGTMNSSSSQASAPPRRPDPAPAPDPAPCPAPDPRGSEALAEVSSITSDYSTTSSLTFPFLAGAESSALSPEVRSVAESRGDEADDERSELVSEGRPAETDSESDFPVEPAPAPGAAPPPRPKTDSESSAEGGSGSLPRVLAGAGGRSTGSLSSSSKSEESEKAEPPWRLRIAERFKLRLRSSADDMFGVSGAGGTPSRTRSPEGRRRKGIRRRHTMGGQRDFAQLAAVVNDDGRGAELSAVDRLKPKCSSQDFSIRDWIVRERGRSGNAASAAAAPVSAQDRPLGAEQLNGDSPQGKSKGALSPGADAHPHKLSGTQVVRSRFYQYL